MNESYLINKVRSYMLPYAPQIAEKASFSSVTLFRAWFYDSQFSKIKFSSDNIEDVPVVYS